ncbi:MbcA/ParS/Xre antitoxin family protein [Paenibacillus sp. ACRSA]|uniref:antitoxin Xre/MbcA/ParS toxin-binding domain-containing protein n=1 Tax=Paenibacillus sp. ACRSA TaxID=2918211 RepID=UPI001EF72F8D|nr:antitoxin Xre/MbcA/ParS toxin-binding domain-containing protein [Paenibacillus sp. ACRSA]MCG7376171.1 MbcA/ParS/Xre antitoxin family protein [Paenibacillus sp. ACRSA]
MSMKEIYLEEFKQDNWDAFVQLFDELYAQVDPKWIERARVQNIPVDVSQVLLCEMGEYAFKWLEKNIPALGDQSPVSYLETEEGTNALRAAILRMPR